MTKLPKALAARQSALKRTYGITLEQYDQLLKKQDGRCAICQRPRESFNKNLAVEHDHKTLEIRGLCCTFCNRYVIGRHRDPTIFRQAAKYLTGPFTGWFVPVRKRKRKKKKRVNTPRNS